MPPKRITAKDITLVGFLAAVLLIVQLSLSFLPNIELVSLLVVLFTQHYKKKTLFIIYIFALIQGVLYGFGIWWIMYLYVWTILYFITTCFKGCKSPIGWAIILGFFGLCFGLLCSIPYFFVSGISGGIAYIISGIPFDIGHCIGNALSALVLYYPLNRLLTKTDAFIS